MTAKARACLQTPATTASHLIRALASPNLEVFLTTYPQPLGKRHDPTYDIQLFDVGPAR